MIMRYIHPKRIYNRTISFVHDFFRNHFISDKAYLSKEYFDHFGRNIDWENPKSFTEKLNWLKLNDRNPLYHILTDKYLVKDYVRQRIGYEHIIPTLGVWDSFDDIKWGALPNKFVLKCNHDSGSVIICRDKSCFDYEYAKLKLNWALSHDWYYFESRQWAYKGIKRKIIAEPLMEDKENDALMDYKFFCFNGEPKVMYMSRDTSTTPTTDFYDMDFNHLPFRMKDPNSSADNILTSPPNKFQEMKEFSRTLSAGFPHVRVDFYVINNKIYFGELTFYHCGGMAKITPEEWDYRLGDMLQL